MPLDGLRAWIGEVERKLGMRTRVFLVLSVIAIGGAGAAIYLAIDAQDNAVSESDVRALQDELEARIDAGAASAGGSETPQVEAEGGDKGAGGIGAGGGPGGDNGANGSGASSGPIPDTSSSGSATKLGELLQEAREATEKAKDK